MFSTYATGNMPLSGITHGTGAWHIIPGVPDWERQMTEWLNKKLGHEGPVGEGIRPRQPKAPQM
jgi:hypothetical protein